jgi:hypothetical protein
LRLRFRVAPTPLEDAEERLAQSRREVMRQRAIVEHLERENLDSGAARELLVEKRHEHRLRYEALYWLRVAIERDQ